MKCPDRDSWILLEDGELTESVARAQRQHAEECATCAARWARVRELATHLRVRPEGTDPGAIVAAVLSRIEVEERSTERPPTGATGWARWSAAALVAVVATCIVSWPGAGRRPSRSLAPSATSEFTPRGARAHDALALAGVQVYTLEGEPEALTEGASVSRDTAYTARYENRGQAGVFLMVFAIDADLVVHWLYPAYLDANEDPIAARLDPTERHRLMPDSVVLEAPALGALRIFTLTSTEPLRVSAIEGLDPETVTLSLLRTRFAPARVDRVTVHVK